MKKVKERNELELEVKNEFSFSDTLTFMGLFNSEVGNHSREYTQGNLGQNVRDSHTSMFPVALSRVDTLAQMKMCGICVQLGWEEGYICHLQENGRNWRPCQVK